MATRTGRFEAAHGGTLFLDEIGDISLNVQVKLLRFLEEREFERVGGNKTIKVDVRVVAATHRDLGQRVRDGLFREDLYYRLNVIELNIPTLRERGLDVTLLADHFRRRFAKENRKPVKGISDDAIALLQKYSWPGNVRELENAIERAVVLSEEAVLTADHFPTVRAALLAQASPVDPEPAEPGRNSPPEAGTGVPAPPPPLPEAPPTSSLADSSPPRTMAEIEREAILRTLASVKGSTSKAAEVLQISARTIQYRLREYRKRSGED